MLLFLEEKTRFSDIWIVYTFLQGGSFKFSINVPPEYNNVPPVVKCLTRVWHPNITEDGAICLSLLRQNSLDGYG